MIRAVGARAGAVLLVIVASACTVPRKGGFDAVTKVVEQRAGHPVHWPLDAREEAVAAEEVSKLLADELSIDDALRIALANNHELRATCEELGIAQADQVQAALFANPVLLASARFPSGSGTTNTELGLAQDFLDVLLQPSRKRLAEAEFEEAKLRVANATLELAADTKVAYYVLQGALQTVAVLGKITDAARVSAEFARRQREAGNLSDLGFLAEAAMYEQVKVDLAFAQAAALADRERLTRLLGLFGKDTEWRIPDRLPELPKQESALEHLESIAIAQRLDLAAARYEVEKLARVHSITLRWRYVPLLEVGVDSENDVDGGRVTGPNLSIALPVFDQGQARVARAEALLRQSRDRLTALAVEIRSEVRDARNRFVLARALAEHQRDVLIPLRERIVAESQSHYNFMLIGVYQLLQAKRDEVQAYRDYVETVRDYWVARSELERAVGARLELAAAREAPAEPPPRQEEHQHHHSMGG